jgi:hypothetical protein
MQKTAAVICLLALLSCGSRPEAKTDAVARAGDFYLYKEDLKGLVPAGTSKEDSTVIIRNFIDRWASQKLLIKQAELNLSDEKKEGYDKLIRQYRVDLYTKAYLEDVVKATVDTVVSETELEAYYKANKENFRTNGVLVRLRYILIGKDNPKYETIKARFFDFRKSDKKFWDTHIVQFKNAALNDTVWVDMQQVYARLPFITPDNRDEYINAGKSIQFPQGDDTYLVKIAGVIDRNQISPYEFVKPTLKEVILNMRKLELIKKFEKDITDDAIKDKTYEIYE